MESLPGRRWFLSGAAVGGAALAACSAGSAGSGAAAEDEAAPSVFFVHDGSPVPPATNGLIHLVPWSDDAGENVERLNGAIVAAARPSGFNSNSIPGGGLVVLPNGVFRVDAPIVMQPGVTLSGAGWGGTTLERAGGDGQPMISFRPPGPTGAYAAEVRDLGLNGRAADFGDPGSHGIVVDASSERDAGWVDCFSRLTNVYVGYCAGTGVRIPLGRGARTRAVYLERVFVANGNADGMAVDGSDCFLSDVSASGCAGAGFVVTGANNHLLNGKAFYNDRGGFVVRGGRSTLAACEAQDNRGDGFRFDRVAGANVSGCTSDTNEDTNFRLVSVRESTLSGLASVFRGGGGGGRFDRAPTGGGIRIEGSSGAGTHLSGTAPASSGGVVGNLADDGSVDTLAR